MQPRQRSRGAGRVIGRLLLAALVLAIGAGAAWVVSVASQPGPKVVTAPPFVIQREFVDPGSAVPDRAGAVPETTQAAAPRAGPPAPPSPASDSVAVWVNKISRHPDIPSRALRAHPN